MPSRTKERILDVAEHLFGERGFPATSLRDITAEADANLASVNYHFGSKESLLTAVLERRLRPINERRIAQLDALEARPGDDTPPLEDVIRAFLSPPFEQQREWGPSGVAFLRVLGRVHSESNEQFRAMFVKQFDEVFKRFTGALRRALPHLEESDVGLRVMFMVGSMAFTMSWGQSMLREPSAARDPDDVLESLVAYAAAGMAAPAPQLVPVARRAQRS